MTIDAAGELVKLGDAYKKQGHGTLWCALLILWIVDFQSDFLTAVVARAHLQPWSARSVAMIAEFAGIGVLNVAMILVLAIGVYLLRLGAKIRTRHDYAACRKMASMIASFRPFSGDLSARTLALLDKSEVKAVFLS